MYKVGDKIKMIDRIENKMCYPELIGKIAELKEIRGTGKNIFYVLDYGFVFLGQIPISLFKERFH